MNEQASASPREALAGLVERVTFHNADNGFCALRIQARGHRDVITVIGHAAVIAAGERVTASGDWGQRPPPWQPVQGALHADVSPDLGRRDREIPRVRDDPRALVRSTQRSW
jgi:hypothetical protein